MASQKPLKGVAYDIAHHAQSGLSYLHPYIGDLCKEAQINEATIDLVAADSYPSELRKIEPLIKSVGALKQKFESILSKQKMELEFISSLKLKFIFHSGDSFVCSVESTLVKSNGTTIVQKVL